MLLSPLICVSHNAPPLNDAEALCTARLLSALASAGVKVHLLAAATKPSLDPGISAELLDERIRVTFVPSETGGIRRFAAAFRCVFHGQYVEWLRPAIRATRLLLQEHRGAILMTRAFPMVSNLTGYYCRSHAKAWVAHFSDPYPPYEWQNHVYSRFLRPVNRRWARRILRRADLVTVTCPNAIRYLEEKSGVAFRPKAAVVPHIALPNLRPGAFQLQRAKKDEFLVAHIGNLMTRRRPDLLLKGALLAMKRYPNIRFLQYGNVDKEILEACRQTEGFRNLDIRHIDNLSPRDAADLQRQVDVNVVVDTDLGLPYSPFILSKYPHSVCSGKPLLLISSEDSDMARFTNMYGGGEFVPFSTPQRVADAICSLYLRRFSGGEGRPTMDYKREFDASQIAQRLLTKLSAL